MYVSDIPLWFWKLTAEDLQYYSHPITALLVGRDCVFTHRDEPWGARCLHVPVLLRPFQEMARTIPIHCGHVAGLDAKGRYLCEEHMRQAWYCYKCSAFLPAGEYGLCETCAMPVVSPLDCEP
jgi:hypothetical protein